MSHLESFGGTDQSYPESCRVDVDMDICLPEPVVEYIRSSKRIHGGVSNGSRLHIYNPVSVAQ